MSRIASIICLVAFLAAPLRASLTIQSSTDGGPMAGPGIALVNFDDLALGSSAGNSGGINVSFIDEAKLVQKGVSLDPTFATPFLSGSNGAGFGNPNQANGEDLTKYITTGTGNAVLDFGQVYNYLGILWGSVDTFNTLSLYLGNSLVAEVTGNDVTSHPDGNQGLGGTYYVNISGVTFDRAIATSSHYAFEFDNVAYGTVPEASTIAVWSILGTIGVGVAYRKQAQRV